MQDLNLNMRGHNEEINIIANWEGEQAFKCQSSLVVFSIPYENKGHQNNCLLMSSYFG